MIKVFLVALAPIDAPRLKVNFVFTNVSSIVQRDGENGVVKMVQAHVDLFDNLLDLR